MNKNRKIKRKIAASVAVGMSVMMGVTPAFAASGTSDSDVYKEETVYVNAKASGKTDKVTVLRIPEAYPAIWKMKVH